MWWLILQHAPLPAGEESTSSRALFETATDGNGTNSDTSITGGDGVEGGRGRVVELAQSTPPVPEDALRPRC
jgi:hypothetical protein